jgi:hypothetical protein
MVVLVDQVALGESVEMAGLRRQQPMAPQPLGEVSGAQVVLVEMPQPVELVELGALGARLGWMVMLPVMPSAAQVALVELRRLAARLVGVAGQRQ